MGTGPGARITAEPVLSDPNFAPEFLTIGRFCKLDEVADYGVALEEAEAWRTTAAEQIKNETLKAAFLDLIAEVVIEPGLDFKFYVREQRYIRQIVNALRPKMAKLMVKGGKAIVSPQHPSGSSVANVRVWKCIECGRN